MDVKPYVIAEGVSLDGLVEDVVRLIMEGYEPVGGLFMMYGQPCQAMVLRDLAGWIDANREDETAHLLRPGNAACLMESIAELDAQK